MKVLDVGQGHKLMDPPIPFTTVMVKESKLIEQQIRRALSAKQPVYMVIRQGSPVCPNDPLREELV